MLHQQGLNLWTFPTKKHHTKVSRENKQTVTLGLFCFQNLSFLAKVEFSAMRTFTFAIIVSSLCSNSCLNSFKNLFMPSSLIWFSKSKKQNNANCVYCLFTYQFSCLPLTWMIWFFLEVWSLPLAPFVFVIRFKK